MFKVNNKDTRTAPMAFSASLQYSAKTLKKVGFVSDGQFREGSLNFNFSITLIKWNYGDTFSSQTGSNLMIVTFAQSFRLGSRKSLTIIRPTR